MKRIINLLHQRIAGTGFLLLTVTISSFSPVSAQEKQLITGKLMDENRKEAIPYAYLSLFRSSDETLVNRTLSDQDGEFKIGPVSAGTYMLSITAIGYQMQSKNIEVGSTVIDAGTIFLPDTIYTIGGAVVSAERTKAKSETDRTTFFISKKMLDASSTGTEVLKLIPGIQVDLMQNISLDGSRDILIFVNGVERDRSFISQLDPARIDKVEIINTPPSNYDGNISGAINIILKEERDSGFSGHINAEIPASGSEMYLFPSYSLNYAFKKLNLYTSYNGEICYLNLNEKNYRRVWSFNDTTAIFSDQYVRQKNWSNRFNYGFDYFISPNDQFNFYAFYNPYSRELDGIAEILTSGSISNSWNARKEDTDKNTSTFYSIYYKHIFNEGRELTLDISKQIFQAENRTDYIFMGSDEIMADRTNSIKPKQNMSGIRMDYITPVGSDLNLSMGIKGNYRKLQDRASAGFNYNEMVLATYGAAGYKNKNIDLSAGLRAEMSASDLENSIASQEFSLLPYGSFRYKLSGKQNVRVTYKRSVRRPNIYQLNPAISVNDPYSVQKGNPLLKSELRASISVEHSIQFNGNYISSGLFYDNMKDVIGNLTFINDTGAFETQVGNMGTICQYGMQVSGTVKLGIFTFNPWFRIYDRYTSVNELTKSYAIRNRHNPVFESSLSAVASFKRDVTASFVIQYNTPKNNIQGNSYSDALYFISLEKTFKHKIKAGIVSAIPFTKSFIYSGSEYEESGFYSHYEGNVSFSMPFWFKLSYQFNTGKRKDKISRDKEEIDNLPKKGF